MGLKLLSRLKFSSYIVLFIIFLEMSSINCDVNSNSTNDDVKIGLKAINFFEKIPENLCPTEYESCWCDYSTMKNVNTNENSNSYRIGSLSIMIDCQFFSENSGNIKTIKESTINSSFNQKTSNRFGHAKKNLLEIPNVSNSLAKFRYLGYVTHIDLSHTGITEVPTDAFKGLTGLQTIVITNCKSLKQIKMFAFRNLPDLKTLIITNNHHLTDLQPHAFGSLRNLNFLSLSMNKLQVIDGYIFSASTSIKIIDFIGNPIQRIKSHAFHGLRNVTDLLLSIKQNVSPIEHIEGDSFISTAFVDHIFLEGIPARVLHTNAFRGLSYCKNLHLSNTYIEYIEANAFYRTNNINLLNLKYSRIKGLHADALRGIFNIELIDLRGNYLSTIDESSFGPLISYGLNEENPSKIINDSIVIIENEKDKYIVKKITFDQNPIQCDCNLVWILSKKSYYKYVSLPEICAGPKGFDCLRLTDLSIQILQCNEKNKTKTPIKAPCDDLKFDVEKDADDVYSVPVPKGKIKYNEGGYRWADDAHDETYDPNYEYETYYDENKQAYETITTTKISNQQQPRPHEKKKDNLIALFKTTTPEVLLDLQEDNNFDPSKLDDENDIEKQYDATTPKSNLNNKQDKLYKDNKNKHTNNSSGSEFMTSSSFRSPLNVFSQGHKFILLKMFFFSIFVYISAEYCI